jgi:transforming growth factor-beta-induced protein
MKRSLVLTVLLVTLMALAACAPIAPAAAPAAAEATAAPAAEAPAADAMATADIVDTAIGAGSFGTLVAAVQAAGLEEALRGEGPFTVFAPTDEAFAKLPAGTVDSLLADPEALSAILLYHVVSGKVMAADVTDGLTADTLNGAPVSFHVADGVMINDANITATDIEASNGVIHVIDTVILPPTE